MIRDLLEPIFPGADDETRKRAQEEFGRHLVERRNRMAALVRNWIEDDVKFPVPIFDRIIDRVRQMDAASRADVASTALLMADQVVVAILGAFALGDDMRADGKCINYAIVAQLRKPGSHEILDEIDVNRGTPAIAIWDMYKRWLSRYAVPDVRPAVGRSIEAVAEDPRHV
jgi:hypothetical protein